MSPGLRSWSASPVLSSLPRGFLGLGGRASVIRRHHWAFPGPLPLGPLHRLGVLSEGSCPGRSPVSLMERNAAPDHSPRPGEIP